jgi:riboflavin synthase
MPSNRKLTKVEVRRSISIVKKTVGLKNLSWATKKIITDLEQKLAGGYPLTQAHIDELSAQGADDLKWLQ